MSKLTDALENANDKNKEVAPVDLEVLSNIVEAELDNVAGGGYSQYGGVHEKSAIMSAEMSC
jgi:hypothetical protein